MQSTVRLFMRTVASYKPIPTTARPISLLRNPSLRLAVPRTKLPRPTYQTHRHATTTALSTKEIGPKQSARPDVPSYQLTFTCKPCKHRSSHRVTKQGYHHGTVLIQCPDCKSRHVISDHLKIFMDEASTLEDILARTAGTDKDVSKLLKKGRLGQREGQLVGNEGEEDLEFWDDGSTSQHTPA